MPKIVDPSCLDRVNHAARVDWAQFADGNMWMLKRGVDFEQTTYRARRAFLSWAWRRGLHTDTWIKDEETIYVRIVKS